MFETTYNGWKVEQQELSKPGKVRVRVDDVTAWCERQEDGTWILTSLEYARRKEGRRPTVFKILSYVDLKIGDERQALPMREALRAYWRAWRKSPEGVLERIAALEQADVPINADVEP